MIYRYRFLPKGLISRLMVRMNRFVLRTDLAWATGVLFEQEDTRVLARATPRGNEIVLQARGSERKALLSVIASELEALNASFRGLDDTIEKWVPCSCSQCQTSTSPELFEQTRLLKRKRDHRLSVECPASYTSVSVLELLDGFRIEQQSTRLDHHTQVGPLTPTGPKPEPAVAQLTTIRIFLASSEELSEDRDAFDLYCRQQNDHLIQQGRYLEVVRWEHFLDAMSNTRLQDEYNRAVRTCDLFVSLFFTKTGTFTREEFDTAHRAFQENGRPYIYTFFKDAPIQTGEAKREDLQSLWDFQDKLRRLEHFWKKYDDVEHLKNQFREQLDRLFKEKSFPLTPHVL